MVGRPLEGRDALLVVGSNNAAATCSAALRAELVRLGRVQEQGVPLTALVMSEWDGVVTGVGDLVQTRRNGWHLHGYRGNTEAPINRQTYRVTAAHSDGGLTVARVTGRDDDGAEQLADPLQLPGGYVREHVTLGYASTVHAAHGRTVGAGYSVLNPGTDAATAYTQHTRGRDTNVMFVVTRNVADTADTGETHKVAPRTAAEVLADVIRPPEEDPNRTALTLAEDSAELARATPTERAEPAQRRRVPAPDEAAAALDRAHHALAEIADRQQPKPLRPPTPPSASPTMTPASPNSPAGPMTNAPKPMK